MFSVGGDTTKTHHINNTYNMLFMKKKSLSVHIQCFEFDIL
jgi:hypothetical protein